MEKIYQDRINRFANGLRLFSEANSADDHNAFTWAENARKDAAATIRSTLVEFLAEGEDIFSRWFPNLYENLQKREMNLTEIDLESNLEDIEYIVKHKNPPPALETLPPTEQLLIAIRKSNLAKARSALECGADVNVKLDNGNTLFIEAVLWPDNGTEIIDELYERGADVSAQDGLGRPIILLAASRGNVKIVQAALDKGVDPNLTAPYGGTALMMAAYYGKLAIIKLLLDAGADPNIIGEDTSGGASTALHKAAESGEFEAARILLEAGADINIRDNQGRTPLETAQHFNRKEVVEILQRAESKL
jgi:uncharacterized protein